MLFTAEGLQHCESLHFSPSLCPSPSPPPVLFIDSLVEGFFAHFNRHYEHCLRMDFDNISLQEQVEHIHYLFKVTPPPAHTTV